MVHSNLGVHSDWGVIQIGGSFGGDHSDLTFRESFRFRWAI